MVKESKGIYRLNPNLMQDWININTRRQIFFLSMSITFERVRYIMYNFDDVY